MLVIDVATAATKRTTQEDIRTIITTTTVWTEKLRVFIVYFFYHSEFC